MAEETNNLLLQEIDDELKAERLRQWWQRFGSWVVGLCVVAVAITVAYQYQRNQRLAADQQVTSVLISSNDLLDRGQPQQAAEILSKSPGEAGAVRVLAKLKAAQAYRQSGEKAKSDALYQEVTAQQEAPVLAAYAALQLGQTEQAVKEGAALQPLAQELRAVQLYHSGKTEEARSLLEALRQNPALPLSARNRIAELLAAIQ